MARIRLLERYDGHEPGTVLEIRGGKASMLALRRICEVIPPDPSPEPDPVEEVDRERELVDRFCEENGLYLISDVTARALWPEGDVPRDLTGYTLVPTEELEGLREVAAAHVALCLAVQQDLKADETAPAPAEPETAQGEPLEAQNDTATTADGEGGEGGEGETPEPGAKPRKPRKAADERWTEIHPDN